MKFRLDEMTENVGEGFTHASFAETELGGEDEMIDKIAKDRYRKATLIVNRKCFCRFGRSRKIAFALLSRRKYETSRNRPNGRRLRIRRCAAGFRENQPIAKKIPPAAFTNQLLCVGWKKATPKSCNHFARNCQSTHNLSEERNRNMYGTRHAGSRQP